MNASLLDRIRKILAKTEEAGCTAEEAATAFAMASRIMAEHGLETADVLAHDPEAMRYGCTMAAEKGRRDFLIESALGVISDYFNVRFFGTHTDAGRVAYLIFGTREDCEIAVFVYSRVIACCRASWDRFRGAIKAPASERKTYVTGFMYGVRVKLDEQRRRLETDRPGSGNELALVASKLDEAFQGITGERQQRTTLAPRTGSVLVAAAGFEDGRKAAINREIE